mgnify:CR=1 FL=1
MRTGQGQRVADHEEPVAALADQCDLATAEAFARRLAPLKTAGTEAATGGSAVDITAASPDHMELLGLGDIHTFDPTSAWRPRPARDRLRVPIGIGDSGGPVHLDIKESAQQGLGPHGLVIGASSITVDLDGRFGESWRSYRRSVRGGRRAAGSGTTWPPPRGPSSERGRYSGYLGAVLAAATVSPPPMTEKPGQLARAWATSRRKTGLRGE